MKFVVVLASVLLLVTLAATTKKKGVGLLVREYHCNDTQVLHDVSWWYDWTYGEGKALHMGCPPRGEFVPMIRVYTGQNINLPSSSQHVLGFNEPNHKGPHPAMTPQAAASHWHQIQVASHGKSLVSPAPARCPHGITGNCTEDPLKWLDGFFKACHNCTIDYVGIHTYTCNIENDMRFLESVHQRYKKQIWLTEFACPHSSSLTHVENYMKGIIPRLERAPFVARYAWFEARITHGNNFIHKENSLLEADSSTLTPLGHLYNSLH